jgi:hypothetical protein
MCTNALLQTNHATCGGPLSVPCHTQLTLVHKRLGMDGRGGQGLPPANSRKPGGQGHRIGGTNSAHDRPTEFERPNKVGTSPFKPDGLKIQCTREWQTRKSAGRSVGNSTSMSAPAYRAPSTDFVALAPASRLPGNRLRHRHWHRLPGFPGTDFGRSPTEIGMQRRAGRVIYSARKINRKPPGGTSPQFGDVQRSRE